MLHNLLKARRILNKNPKTNKRDLISQASLTSEEFDYLIESGIIEKRGNTKGTEWHWVGAKPDYEMVRNFLPSSEFFEDTPDLLETPVNRYEIRINDTITLTFSADTNVSLRRDNGNEVIVNDPARLKEFLSLLY